MNVRGIEVLAPGIISSSGAGYPQLRYDEVDVNNIKLFHHRATHYRTWVEGWCRDCDEEDLQTVWVVYPDVTSRGIILDAPAPPEGVDKALELARHYFKENA